MNQSPLTLHWDHNAHYHPWLLRQLPEHPGLVLDVGCGAGRLACTLAGRGARVDAVDRSPAMLALARERCPNARVTWIEGDVLDPGLPLATGYDAITSVASLHHLPLEPALRRFRNLLRPGGVLAVVGLSRAASPADVWWSLVAIVPNAAVGVWRAVRRRSCQPAGDAMPVRDPTDSLGAVRAIAAGLLPGTHIRRALYWRYLLRWTAPLTQI